MPPKKSTVQVLLLTQKADVKEVALPTSADGSVTLQAIQTLLKKKESPEIVGTYKYKSQTLFVFGYTTGKAGTENKHELPPPHDSVTLFGDLIILCSKDDKNWMSPVPFKMSDYEAFYTRAFGGFEDLESEGEEEETEEVAEEVAEDVADDVAEDVAEEDEEEDAGDEGADADVDAEVDADAEVILPTRVVKKKKRSTAVAVDPGAAEVYSSYLHVSVGDELSLESFEEPYDITTLNVHRSKSLSSLKSLFAELLSGEEVNQLERCIYNGALKNAGQRHIGKAWTHNPFVEMYQMFAKHIAANFHPKTYVENTELYTRFKSGEITFKDISEMDTYQLFEERWKDSFLQQQVREKRQLEGNKAMATDQFLCMRCHKRECTYYEMQTRSADEPMTIFITCVNCGKHWRQ